MKRALVSGAAGFIGSHLVRRLKEDGYFVRGVDFKCQEFSKSAADEFLFFDLRDIEGCMEAVMGGFDEIYQLAADMGGMGFIESYATDIMRNNSLINLNMIKAAASSCHKYFFSSSVCVYPDMRASDPMINEENAYPAFPHNEYGWEKLYAERAAAAFGNKYGFGVRIARFENCYGPEGTYTGGREKAPAAFCRKAAEAEDGGEIEVWGDGTARRNFIYVDDLVDGVRKLMDSEMSVPVNIGTPEIITVDELVRVVIAASEKNLTIKHVDGPVGVVARNFDHAKIESLGWSPKMSLRNGIQHTYDWVHSQIQGGVHA